MIANSHPEHSVQALRVQRFRMWHRYEDAMSLLDDYIETSHLSVDTLGSTWGVNVYPNDKWRPLRVNFSRREGMTVSEAGFAEVLVIGTVEDVLRLRLPDRAKCSEGFPGDDTCARIEFPIDAGGSWFRNDEKIAPLVRAFAERSEAGKVRASFQNPLIYDEVRARFQGKPSPRTWPQQH